MNRDFKGIWIPAEVWLNPDLTMQEKLFLVEIISLDGPDGCFANNKYFADFFGISKVRVSEVINSLIEKGFVTSQIKVEEGNKRILKTLVNFSLTPSQTIIEDPHKEKFKHNNTSNNTSNKKEVDAPAPIGNPKEDTNGAQGPAKDEDAPVVENLQFENQQQAEYWQSFMELKAANSMTEIFKAKKPLTPAELEKLLTTYTAEEVETTLLEAENWPEIKKRSVYLTVKTWITRNHQRQNNRK